LVLRPRKSSNANIKADIIIKEDPSSALSSSSTSSSSSLLHNLGKDAFKLGGWKTKSEIFSISGKSRQANGAAPHTWRVLLQTKKGAQQFFIRSGTSKADKHRAIQIACGSQGICPEIHDLKLKPVKPSSFPVRFHFAQCVCGGACAVVRVRVRWCVCVCVCVSGD